MVFDSIPDDPFVAPTPPTFLWGASTSAHQIEGGNVLNDWARFEAIPGNIREGHASGVAADHWNRLAEDVDLLTALGANAYRFSIEWSRVEPIEGEWDTAAWAHYQDEVALLRQAGITPMVTLLHFTLPGWLAAREADRGFNWAFYDSVERGAITFHLAGFPEVDEPMAALAGSADFFGINYYRRNIVRFSPQAPGLVELLQGPGPL